MIFKIDLASTGRNKYYIIHTHTHTLLLRIQLWQSVAGFRRPTHSLSVVVKKGKLSQGSAFALCGQRPKKSCFKFVWNSNRRTTKRKHTIHRCNLDFAYSYNYYVEVASQALNSISFQLDLCKPNLVRWKETSNWKSRQPDIGGRSVAFGASWRSSSKHMCEYIYTYSISHSLEFSYMKTFFSLLCNHRGESQNKFDRPSLANFFVVMLLLFLSCICFCPCRFNSYLGVRH